MGAENVLALLQIEHTDGTKQTIPVAKSPFNIGRAPNSDLQLPHQLVSRNHARLLFQGSEVVLLDLNSANGTIVEGKKLAPNEPYGLAYGEAFGIGPYTLRLGAAPGGPDVEAPAEETGLRAGEPPMPPGPPPVEESRLPYDQAFGLPSDVSRYLQHLPPIYQADPFLGRFLVAFEGVLAPIEQIVDNLDIYLIPQSTPAFFLDQLAGWLGLTLDEKWPLAKRRAVVAEAAELYRRRGTRWGLARYLEIYTGITPEISEPDDRPYHFHVLLRVPPGQSVDRGTVERIIQANKPAHTTYSLEITAKK